MIEEIIAYNKQFVENKEYEPYITSKFPDKKIAIVTCMDTRLIELLPAALGLKNGDAKIIKNAGGIVVHPFGSVMRSLLIAIYDLNVEEVYIIAHTDCGVRQLDSELMIQKMVNRGVAKEQIDIANYYGVNLNDWLSGFDDVDNAVKSSVDLVKKHPFIPKDVSVYGFILNSTSGLLVPIK